MKIFSFRVSSAPIGRREDRETRKRDALVAEQVLAGNRGLYRELVERYQSRVYNVVLRMVGNPADAEDLTQQSFVEAYQVLNRYDPSRSFYTWLMRITVNNCKDHLKSHKRKEGQLDREVSGASALFSGRIPGPEQEAADRERLGLVAESLSRLDDKYRIPLLLKEVEGMSYNEMKLVLGLPVTTLKIRVVRARAQLQKAASSWMNEES